jgi:hypothetical protein
MDMHMLLVGHCSTVLSGSRKLFLTFAVLPGCRPPMMVALGFFSMYISNDIWELLFLLQGKCKNKGCIKF